MDNLTRAGLTASGDIDLMRRFMLKTSARNKLMGTVMEVRTGAVNDEILLRIAGGQVITATITRESTQELELAPGKEALALVKASSVIVGAPARPAAVGPQPVARHHRGGAHRRGQQRNPDRPGRRHHAGGDRHQ